MLSCAPRRASFALGALLARPWATLVCVHDSLGLMPVTKQRAQELALALENSSAAPHFDRVAFRTPRRIFATLARTGADMNFMLDRAQQAHFCELSPHALAPVAGGWGRMGCTSCDLAAIDAKTFSAVLKAAHERANAPRPKRTRKKQSAK